MTTIAIKHLGIDQETEILTKSIDLKYYRSWSSNLKQNVNLPNATFSLPNPCILLNKTGSECKSTPIVQQVTIYLI